MVTDDPHHLPADEPPPRPQADLPWISGWPEIRDLTVRAAFGQVDRARFVPAALRDQAYADAPLPIGEGQTISQPFVIALMVQALALRPGARVLEIGAGSGYQTAILCELVRSPGQAAGASVYAVERSPALARQAAAALQQAGYAPHLHVGDGAAGWPAAAPFDAIVVSAAALHAPRALAAQLADGGRLVLPIGSAADDQMLWLIRRTRGRLAFAQLGLVRFVPLLSPLLDDPANRLPLPDLRGAGQETNSE